MTTHHPSAVIILAAGQGTRMKSAIPKVLHRIGGRSLLGHAMYAARQAGPQHLAVVVRHERERVAAHVAELDAQAVVADQDEVPGTGRACECGLDALPADLTGTVLVTMGDVPLLAGDTLLELTRVHEERGSAVTLLSAVVDDAGTYGRVVRDADGELAEIMEFKDAKQRREAGDPDYSHVVDIREYNSGIYAFDVEVLRRALGQVGQANAQGEKYLTDVIKIAREEGRTVVAHPLADLQQTEGVNDKVQLAALGKELNRRVVTQHLRDGVIVVDPDTTWIDADVTIGQDTVIRPGTQLLGATTIGSEATIGPDTTISDCEVGDGASVVRTQAEHAQIGPRTSVGPFSYLRPGTILGEGGKIGGFVETKNADIGPGAKVPHLTYCGDATIGEGANIGAGTIFANYDGVAKHHTTVGRHSFVGSDSVLVAPVEIADGAYVAAGSTIEGRVEAGQIAVARGRQRNVDGWVARRRAGTPTATAAQEALSRQETDGARSTDDPADGIPDQTGGQHRDQSSQES
ncbi:MAG: bifunctional UDP-N-acetylglucosamine diphosphorylase/glucosamine-1-phosphate N-acetyltransferase GlmU [Arsenicicoccus sp.]|uniref:bifunctional UDP-N-acetylglucosamine diphosphorylase/glucosamine-1-phosphate N-acetyltransferase GlmU n=1 Tax=Serinicoccus profundi TaxID=1078471 RepID=UPI000255E899|nr:bifunctional UDP-N-acetylglucosamine diphosphorylase/glucosamine-1-phosphate N-acetyltransferase GlmU [Serinicoccus profundi]PZU42242.1 MAG: bifunctional UDP-N-acetylglucosamine diphosphorylase/glucosamine-1-phosphate N-acetyltransferase GlmU [Arsenicicoccus sp.]